MIELLGRFDLPGWATHYSVVFLRVLGLFLFLPVFGSDLLPLRIRVGVASVIAVALVPLTPAIAVAPIDALSWALVASRELCVGLGIGFAAKMIFAGIEGAAGLLAGQSGFAMASMVDPTSGDQALAPALFQNLVTIALFLAADLHHLYFGALMRSYELLPSAASLPSFAGFDGVTSMLGLRLFGVAVELAAPALILTVAADLVMALVGRAMPQVPILLVGYPLKMVVGLVAMAVLVTTSDAALGWMGRIFTQDTKVILAALGS